MKSPARIRLSADGGAGNLKIVTDQHIKTFSMRSLVMIGNRSQFRNGADTVGNDVFFYEDGSSTRLTGKYWVAGDGVLVRDGEPDTPADNATLKVENALPLLLAAVIESEIVKPGYSDITITMTHHDPVAMGSRLTELVSGPHRVVAGGQTYNIQFQFPNAGVLPEGSEISKKTSFSTLDIGFLTALLSKRRKGTVVGSPAVSKYGVGNLIERISNHQDLRTKLGGLPGSKVVIGSALVESSESTDEKPKVYYRASGQCLDITSVYLACVKDWVKDALAPAMAALKEHEGQDYQVIAIGGGSKLPRLQGFLEKRGIRLHDGDPVFANAQTVFDNRVRVSPCLEFEPFDAVMDSIEQRRAEQAVRRTEQAKSRKAKAEAVESVA